MTGTIIMNGKAGAMVGNTRVFTYEEAKEVFRAFAQGVYSNLTIENSSVLDAVAMDMVKLGFTCEELDVIELEVLVEACKEPDCGF